MRNFKKLYGAGWPDDQPATTSKASKNKPKTAKPKAPKAAKPKAPKKVKSEKPLDEPPIEGEPEK